METEQVELDFFVNVSARELLEEYETIHVVDSTVPTVGEIVEYIESKGREVVYSGAGGEAPFTSPIERGVETVVIFYPSRDSDAVWSVILHRAEVEGETVFEFSVSRAGGGSVYRKVLVKV